MVDWIGLAISDAKGKVTYDGAFLTSLRVTRENVAEIAACARARLKIENESFNVLKTTAIISNTTSAMARKTSP